MIWEIWIRFTENYLSSNKSSQNIAIVEQLFPSKTRYSFTQFIASKNDKHGKKLG